MSLIYCLKYFGWKLKFIPEGTKDLHCHICSPVRGHIIYIPCNFINTSPEKQIMLIYFSLSLWVNFILCSLFLCYLGFDVFDLPSLPHCRPFDWEPLCSALPRFYTARVKLNVYFGSNWTKVQLIWFDSFRSN